MCQCRNSVEDDVIRMKHVWPLELYEYVAAAAFLNMICTAIVHWQKERMVLKQLQDFLQHFYQHVR